MGAARACGYTGKSMDRDLQIHCLHSVSCIIFFVKSRHGYEKVGAARAGGYTGKSVASSSIQAPGGHIIRTLSDIASICCAWHISELLGPFGDTEMSPECLDGAQRLFDPKYCFLYHTISTVGLLWYVLLDDILRNLLMDFFMHGRSASCWVHLRRMSYHPSVLMARRSYLL